MYANLRRSNFEMWLFGLFKVPMILFCRPRILSLNQDHAEIRIKLRRRTRNHLKSMYFGALAVGADITGGVMAYRAIKNSGKSVSLVFKNFSADFYKRPESHVHFTCLDGELIHRMIEETIETGERVSKIVHITASCPAIDDEIVAKFELTLSLKCRN